MTRGLRASIRHLTGRDRGPQRRMRRRHPLVTGVQASATVFVILRRMRAPLIILIIIFSISVLGLTFMPG